MLPSQTSFHEATVSAPVIVIRNLVKQFGYFAALRGINAEFYPSRLHVLVGDNGAGKTSLLRIIAGLSKPTRGTISLMGAANIREVCAEIGYMAHPSLLYDEMSGMENLRYFARLYGIAEEQRCRDTMTTVGLDPALPRPVGQYSQGMRQRLSLARAIIHDPRILLLDEPFSNLDTQSAADMVALLRRMKDAGKTILVVTHQPALLENDADEVVQMQAGMIVKGNQGLDADDRR